MALKRKAAPRRVDGKAPTQFEVKGTAAGDIAWQQLKVSSQASHDLLVSGKASVLRVTKVYGDQPVVFELRCANRIREELDRVVTRWPAAVDSRAHVPARSTWHFDPFAVGKYRFMELATLAIAFESRMSQVVEAGNRLTPWQRR